MHVMFQQIKNMKRVLLIVLVLASLSVKAQVYQIMPQYGYQAPRMMFDSTLQIPTFCGVPTLKSVQFVTKKSAIAYDSCNNKFYTYNPKTQVWSEVTGTGGGGGSDTAKVVIAKVRNIEATTLNTGEVVYIFGSTGNIASVKRASNKHDSTSSKTFGVVRANIAPNDTGYVTTQGQVEKLNLGSFSEGDVLWLDSIAGGITKIKPVAPYHGVFIGIVERANNGNGLAYIKPQNGYEADEIHDFLIQTPKNNDILVYSDTLKIWKNRPYGLQSTLFAGNQSYTTSTNPYKSMSLRDSVGGVTSYLVMNYGGGATGIIQYQNGYFQNNLTPANASWANLQTYGSYVQGGSAIGLDLSLSGTFGHCMQFFNNTNGNNRRLSAKFTTSTLNFKTTSYLPETSGTLANKILMNGTTYNPDDNGQINLGTIGGSTGVNGLNGTTNIGLGGTLTSATTTINGNGNALNIGTTSSPITTLNLDGQSVRMENLNPRHTDAIDKMVVVVMDTTNNNQIRTIPINQLNTGNKVLVGKFSSESDGLGGYTISWRVIQNTTGITWSLYKGGGGRFILQDNVADPNAGEQFNDCTWFGGVMFWPNKVSTEKYGQIYNVDKHKAEISIYDASGTGVDEVFDASFEIRFFETCSNGDTTSP